MPRSMVSKINSRPLQFLRRRRSQWLAAPSLRLSLLRAVGTQFGCLYGVRRTTMNAMCRIWGTGEQSTQGRNLAAAVPSSFISTRMFRTWTRQNHYIDRRHNEGYTAGQMACIAASVYIKGGRSITPPAQGRTRSLRLEKTWMPAHETGEKLARKKKIGRRPTRPREQGTPPNQNSGA